MSPGSFKLDQSVLEKKRFQTITLIKYIKIEYTSVEAEGEIIFKYLFTACVEKKALLLMR